MSELLGRHWASCGFFEALCLCAENRLLRDSGLVWRRNLSQMLRSPCLGMPRRVSPHPSMWGIPDVSLPDLLWRRSLPCLPKEPAGKVCAIQTYGSSKVCAMRTIALLVTPVLHPPCILQGLKCMPGRTALLQSRAELGEVGGCAAQGCTGSTRRRNAGDCLFCLSTAPAMTYCRGGPAQLINCVLLTREAAQQEVKPQSRIPTSRETITGAGNRVTESM